VAPRGKLNQAGATIPGTADTQGERAFLDADRNGDGHRGGPGLTPRASRLHAAALALVGFVGLCLLVGAANTTFLRDGGLAWYLSLKSPPGTPPGWLFAPLWTTPVGTGPLWTGPLWTAPPWPASLWATPRWVAPLWIAPFWTALYAAVGTAAWLVWRRVGAGEALRLWGWQIAANAFWAPAFFGLHQIALALVLNLVLLVLIALTTRAFARVVPAAGWLMLPALGWTAYAAYLNVGLWWLNGV
jgi:translocator protein